MSDPIRSAGRGPFSRGVGCWACAAVGLLALSSGATAGEPTRPTAAPVPPNIVHIMTDDQGWLDTGYMGHPHAKTPQLDDMAKHGLVFTRFYSPAPVCTPSRVSITFGRHCTRYGVITVGNPGVAWFAGKAPSPAGHVTMAAGLKAKGYTTGHFGKQHGASSAGMDINQATGNTDEDILHTGRALEFMHKAVAARQPFYVRLWLGSPHRPYAAEKAYLDLYPGLPEAQRGYLAELSRADDMVGRVRKELRRLGVAADTLVWFSSDNGSHTVPGDKLRGGKNTLWEGGIRVPGIIEYPSLVKEARRTDIPATGMDILPTIFDLVGAGLPKYPLDGLSLLPLLRGEMKDRPKKIPFWFIDSPTHPGLRFALVDNRFKLHSDLTGMRDELYDLLSDPAEKKNLVGEHPDVAAAMREELRRWKESVEKSLAGGDQ